MAWWYRYYAKEQSPEDQGRYESAEDEAKARKWGLGLSSYYRYIRKRLMELLNHTSDKITIEITYHELHLRSARLLHDYGIEDGRMSI